MAIIARGVGWQGANTLVDARVIQTMFNFVVPAAGGPGTLLKVDGVVGTKTMTALQNFQKKHLGFSDGLITPKGPTLAKMAAVFGAPAVTPTKPTFAGLSLPRLTRRSGWTISTSGGFDVGIGLGGLSGGHILVTEDAKPTIIHKFNVGSAGVSLGPMPVSLSFSSISAPGSGTRILSPPGVTTPLKKSDLAGPAMFISGGANFAVGGDVTMIVFNISPLAFAAFQTVSFLALGPAGISPVVPAILASKGVGITFGAVAAIPNIGVSLQFGFVTPA